MAMKPDTSKISVYIPQPKQDEHIVERLIKLGAKKNRSVNYLVVEALTQYVKREEEGAKASKAT